MVVRLSVCVLCGREGNNTFVGLDPMEFKYSENTIQHQEFAYLEECGLIRDGSKDQTNILLKLKFLFCFLNVNF